ncbi:FtsW/RodA/SpoVE family cell cycle protein [uncultured Clostridium sp.]|uniref:FtsW/RodA/SpoVE family cell cycle protein n=1 Tax=uncultured Clostridium sp. TaxID=59620 RepID=UPI00258597F8|nr:FtsW/RodA/SpoVE family cell cycle protein [uncultured Clostridium sp.]MDU1350272.1 FtsW/RodA/SpoVE family cell cycle protein [Clostridium argentinense]
MDIINSYLEEICSVIKCREVHGEIKEEIRNHIEELSTEYIDNGYESDEAYKLAIRDMGDSGEIGFKLNKVYEKRIEYKTLIIAILLSLFGVGFVLILNNKLTIYASPANQIIAFIIGIAAFIAIYYFDYRKLEKYSYHIFIVSVILSFIQVTLGEPIFGRPGFRIANSLITNLGICILTGFLISISGIIKGLNFKEKGQILIAIVIFIIGNFSLFYMMNIVNNLIFTVTFIILLFKNCNNKFIPSAFCIAVLGSIIVPIISRDYFRNRLLMFLNYKSDPFGSGYQNMKVLEVLSSSKFIGNFDSSKIEKLPGAATDFIFTSIISLMGWVAALAIVVLVLAFIIILFKNTKMIKDKYGKNIMISIVTSFAMQFIINILVSMNLFPSFTVTLPFIGYGGSAMLSNMIMLGLISSIYSRKNLKNSYNNIISS